MDYDLIVVGGGPAGMMTAGRAAERGLRVALIEKNHRLGMKLLITGKGRCNITNYAETNKDFINHLEHGKFLHQALNLFNIPATIDFFENLGVKTKVERGQRVFPVSDKSIDVLNALQKYLDQGQVDILLNSSVAKFVTNGSHLEKIILANKKIITANCFAICAGGKSYPTTGSSGDGYAWLKALGHQINQPSPSLVPVVVKEKFVADLEGLSLKNVTINILNNNKKIASRFGEAIFTARGMSGPIILDLSKTIGRILATGPTYLSIDFKPTLDFKLLDQRIQKDFHLNKNKLFKNSLSGLLPAKMIPVVIKLSKINPNKKVNSITKEERKNIVHLLKEFRLTVAKLEGFDRAIVTTGGVDLSEIDPRTMKSKIIDNLYLAGEILDLDGPTGGYNLQICWSTGFVAGSSVEKCI